MGMVVFERFVNRRHLAIIDFALGQFLGYFSFGYSHSRASVCTDLHFLSAADVRGKAVWIDKHVDAATNELVKRHDLIFTSDVHAADFCILDSSRISKPRTSSRGHWVDFLRRIPLLNPGVLGASSPQMLLQDKPALAKKRAFLLSRAFKVHHKQLALLIHQCAANFPDHKWKFFVDHQKFLKSHRDKSSIEHIALLSAAEVHKPAFATVRALTGQSFFGLISQLEPERSFFGRASQRGR